MSEAVLKAAGLPGRSGLAPDPAAGRLIGPAADRDPAPDRPFGSDADSFAGATADRHFGAAAERPGESVVDHRSSTEDEESTAGGRHFVRDELVQAATYRLTPDRVARAKVREIITGDEEGQETTRLPSVPRPRSS